MIRRPPKRTLRAVLVVACLAPACRTTPPSAPSPAVATYSGGQVSAADVDAAVLDLPPARRQPDDGDLGAWYERIARDIALQRLLLLEARRDGLDGEAEFRHDATEAHRQATVDVFLEKDAVRPPQPTEGELRVFYDAHRDEFQVAPARLTLHIFRRVEPGADPRPALKQLEALRARVIGGADFGALAAEHSESESRHQEGVLGWIVPGQLSPDLDRVIASLRVGVPSEPIRSREGVHLFLVREERGKKAFSFPEVRPLILRRLVGERWEASLRRSIGDALPADGFAPEGEELRRILASGDPEAPLLRLGDFALTLGDFQAKLAALGALDPGLRTLSPQAVLSAIRQRELIYRHCVEKGLDRRPEVQEREGRLLDRTVAGRQLRRRLLARVDGDPGALEEHYRNNRARFSEPLRLRVRKLSVPLSAGANEAMARLEGARRDLDRGARSLSDLGSALGGRLEESSWTTLTEIARGEPRAAAFVIGLSPGHHSPPFRTATDIVMVALLERREPEPLPFAQVRARVRDDFLAAHRHEQYTALSSEILAGAGFRLVPTGLQGMVGRPLARDGS